MTSAWFRGTCHWIGHPSPDSPAFNPHHGSPFSPPKTRAVTALEIYLDRLKPSAPTQPMAVGTSMQGSYPQQTAPNDTFG